MSSLSSAEQSVEGKFGGSSEVTMNTVVSQPPSLNALLEQPKYEIIPMKRVEQSFEFIPKNAKVSVTVSPSKGIEATLELADQIGKYVAPEQITPHVSARLVEGKDHVKYILERVRDLGMKEIFVVGGDASEPVGPYKGSFDLVRAIRDVDTDVRLGVTAYPEGHPSIPEEVLEQDLLNKQPYAQFMATQLCFDAATIKGWLETRREAGVTLPLQIGMAGVVDMIKLTQIATRIGVGDSLRYLTKHAGTVFKLMSGYKPDDLLENLTPIFGDPFYNVEAFHVYTFNQLEKTERWRKEKLKEIGSRK